MVVLTEDESGLRGVEDQIAELADEVVEGFPDVPLAHHLLEQVRQQAGGHLPEHRKEEDEFKCGAYQVLRILIFYSILDPELDRFCII